MKQDQEFNELERNIRSLPEPDYKKIFTEEKLARMNENLRHYARYHDTRKKKTVIFKRLSAGMVLLAAFALIAILAFPEVGNILSSFNSQQWQVSDVPTALDENKSHAEPNDFINAETDKILYTNKEFGFTLELPKGWEGYMIKTSTWEGIASADTQQISEKGPMLSVRHPEWTQDSPKQDIPIMIFTLTQWSSLEKQEFHIGAAPIGPTLLGQNKMFVFAIPARYNNSFLDGYEEVEKILKSNPLQTNNPTK